MPVRGASEAVKSIVLKLAKASTSLLQKPIVNVRCARSNWHREKKAQKKCFAPLPNDVQARATLTFIHKYAQYIHTEERIEYRMIQIEIKMRCNKQINKMDR